MEELVAELGAGTTRTAGDGAVAGLFERAQSAGIEAMVLSPQWRF